MANKTRGIEAKLDELFVHNAPRLPYTTRKALVAWMPIVSVVLGVLSLLSALGLWRWAHATEKMVGVCNNYSVSGCGNLVASRFTVWMWAGLVLIITQGLLYLLAYAGLHNHRRAGWYCLYYAVLLQLIYSLTSLFIGYNRLFTFVGGLLASYLGFYVVFQVRGLYRRERHVPAQQVMAQRAAEPPHKHQVVHLTDGFEKPREQQ